MAFILWCWITNSWNVSSLKLSKWNNLLIKGTWKAKQPIQIYLRLFQAKNKFHSTWSVLEPSAASVFNLLAMGMLLELATSSLKFWSLTSDMPNKRKYYKYHNLIPGQKTITIMSCSNKSQNFSITCRIVLQK